MSIDHLTAVLATIVHTCPTSTSSVIDEFRVIGLHFLTKFTSIQRKTYNLDVEHLLTVKFPKLNFKDWFLIATDIPITHYF